MFDVLSEFSSWNSVLIYFLNNVDIVKFYDEWISVVK